ncbi:Hypothetical protein GLP15_2783 [Giardia lamblia P15]|uniref:Uncharacterized protein n=1 Tax=Giardia intestinalis (strain P15) TaxID=658858 RepID=E1F1Y9_GIAIA|nr:Hypothetical protein GLP15_2783 [Giardia lamblia P15]
MSISLRQRSLQDQLPPQMTAPRAKYNRKWRVTHQNEDKKLHIQPNKNPGKTSQESNVPTSAKVYTLVSPLISPLTPISSDLMRIEQIEARRPSPRALFNYPLINHHFLLPQSTDIATSVIRLWNYLRFPFSEQRYAMRSFIANESLLLPYLKRLDEFSTLLRAYNHCSKTRIGLLDRFRANLYGSAHRDSIIIDILELRELTLFIVSLDNEASAILGRPISLAKILGRTCPSSEAFFFDECLFTEETIATVMLATQFIRTMSLIQLQTLINIFFDKCINWYTPADSFSDQLADYEKKARKIVSLCFLLGLVVDAQFEGNVLPALFMTHLTSIKGRSLVTFRNELFSQCNGMDLVSLPTKEVNQPYINIPLQPLIGLTNCKTSLPEQEHMRHHSPVNNGIVETILLTPSEVFHAILTDKFLKEIDDEFLLFCNDLGYSLPLIPVEPKETLVEVYRVTNLNQSANTSTKSLDTAVIDISVPSPFGVESIWVNMPDYTEFSISNAYDRSIEGTMGINPIQLLGEEEYDLLGVLNWPRVHITPFLVEGASKLMKRLIANSIERRSKSLPTRSSKEDKPQAKKKKAPHSYRKSPNRHSESPPPPPSIRTTTVLPGSSKSVPTRPRFIRKVIVGSTAQDPPDIHAQRSKSILTLRDLESKLTNQAGDLGATKEAEKHNNELGAHEQSMEDTKMIVSADLTAIFLGHNSPTDESPLSSKERLRASS